MKTTGKVVAAACVSISCTITGHAIAGAPTNSPIESSTLFKFETICDGSAAVRLGDSHILVANDETNVVYVFSNKGGMPTAHYDIGAQLNLVGEPKHEIDLEGMVIVNQAIWWIGSHGLDGDGEQSPNRRTLFSTNIPALKLDDLKVKPGPVDLTEVLLRDPDLGRYLTSEVQAREPKKGGVNIEGLAQGPGNASKTGISLIIGFRSPLTDSDPITGNAILARIVSDGNGFSVDKVWFLDLKDRGVRDIVKHGDSYTILAGDVDEGKSFALYEWNGSSDTVTSERDLGKDLGLEALVDMRDHWLALADDGNVLRPQSTHDGKAVECKKSLKKNTDTQNVYFRGIELKK
jgi:hypothetical protein